MALLVLGLFVGLVLALSYLAHRTDASTRGCCVPADPCRDLRMRAAFEDPDGGGG